MPSRGGELSIRGPFAEAKGSMALLPALPKPAPPSLSFPASPHQACLPWTPTTQKVSQTDSSTSPPPKSPRRALHPSSCPGFMFFFFFSLQIKTVLSTMVRAPAPPLHSPPTPHTYFVPRVPYRSSEGLMGVTSGVRLMVYCSMPQLNSKNNGLRE